MSNELIKDQQHQQRMKSEIGQKNAAFSGSIRDKDTVLVRRTKAISPVVIGSSLKDKEEENESFSNLNVNIYAEIMPNLGKRSKHNSRYYSFMIYDYFGRSQLKNGIDQHRSWSSMLIVR